MNSQLKKSMVWKIVPAAITFESFQKNVLAPIYLKPSFPQSIKAHLEIVEKLLLHSYYEYSFIDIALTQAVFSLEKAMRIKWSEIHSKKTNLNFAGLSKWFLENHYFETNNLEVFNQLRNIRNGKVHDSNNSVGGVVFLRKVFTVIDQINDLYEDKDLRKERQEALSILNTKLETIFKSGSILNYKNNRLIIHKIFPVLICNKSNPNILNIVLCPIFDLNVEVEKSLNFLYFNLKDWAFENDEFIAMDETTEFVFTLSPIIDNKNLEKYTNWENDFNNKPDQHSINCLMDILLNDYFIKSLRTLVQLP